MEKPQLVVLRWSGFSFVAKETQALIYGGEIRIFASIEEILPHFPLNFFVMSFTIKINMESWFNYIGTAPFCD